MGIADDVESVSTSQIWGDWKTRKGQVVPTTEDIALRANEGVELEATFLFADLAQSSHLAQHLDATQAASVIRAYLRISALIIRHFKGEIRSFDGDRVMGIFIGGSQRNTAVKTALALNWAMEKVLRPDFELKFDKIPGVYLNQGIGIAHGEALLTRGGIRENSDLVSIGPAPNIAAKLSDLRSPQGKTINVSSSVYNALMDDNKLSKPGGEEMFQRMPDQTIGGKTVRVYGCGWYRKP